ncbi:MAG: D-alanyl-D-alanine carboxypeptidase [Bacteroidetes bacterium]|jgi:CubicO group peptidase (beta-lactamase class C family)|nr:D-alanyl-D-alanine carboxypeptidase [Bacteroidota bacterium]
MKKLITYFACIPVLFFSVSLRSQSGINPGLAQALQNSINSMRTSMQVKGISAAAYIPGQGMWKGVTGVSHDSTLIDTTMLFSIGSITKTFVAAEIFKLIEGGQLSLNDSVYNLLPSIPNVNPNITVKQLLGHKSGLADYLNANWQNGMAANYNAIWYAPQAINAFLPAPLAAPGGSYKYINTNYALLGMIVEAKTGDSLHKVLRNNFLSPLGLNNTHMEVFETYTNTIAHNWSAPNFNPALASDESAVPHNALWSSVSAAGGYMGDPADLAKWGYNLYSGNVINQSSLTQMLTFTGVSSSYFNGYGLGCQRFPGNGRTYWGHAGNYFGYAACMLYYPQDSICVAVLINQDCYGATPAKPLIDLAITQAAVGLKEAIKGNKTMLVFPNPSQSKFTISIEEGKYRIELIDAMGKIVYADNFSGTVYEFNNERFNEGIYQLKIHSDKGSFSEKVIIMR